MLFIRISEEDLEELRTYVEVIRRDSNSYDYRLRKELDQVPDLEATEQAEGVLNAVEELNQVMIEASIFEIKEKIEQLENILASLDTVESEYLEYLAEKTREIIDKCLTAMRDDPEYLASSRRAEVLEILQVGNRQMNKRMFEQMINEVDERENAPLKLLDKEGRQSYQTLSNWFDDCIDKSYGRFLKTKMGEYMKKSLDLKEKFKKNPSNNEEIVKLNTELTELKKRLSREDQQKVSMIDLSGKTRFEILSSLLSENEFDHLVSQLKVSLKPAKKSRVG